MVLVLYKIRSIYPFMQETHRTMYGKTSESHTVPSITYLYTININ